MNANDIPAGIQALGPDAVARLEALLAQAEQAQTDEAEAALQTALRIVPRLLRPIVSKVLIG